MSAPLLYHVLNNLLTKGELVDSHFILHRYGSNPVSGVVQAVKLAVDGGMVVYVRHGSDIEFRSMDEYDADQLHLRKTKHGVWMLENVPKGEVVEEEIEEKDIEEGVVASESDLLDDDAPLLIHLIQQRMDKDEPIFYTAEVEDKFDRLVSKHYILKSMKRILHGEPRTSLEWLKSPGPGGLMMAIPDEFVHRYSLEKHGQGWELLHVAA